MNFKILGLKKIPIFTTLDNNDLKKIASVAYMKSYKKNRVIFSQGDTGNILFFLMTGIVKVFLTDNNGRECIIKIIYEKDFFGEMALLDNDIRSASIVALKDSKVLFIYKEDLFNLINCYPIISYNLMDTLSNRLRKADAKIATLGFLDAYGKVSQVLLDLIANNVKLENKYHIIDSPISRQEMAEMAGVSRETFSRILNKFVSAGYVKLEGKKIIIFNQEILEDKTII